MLLESLFWAFFRIGAFGFGGGYAMLPLIEREVVTNHHWLTKSEMVDIIAISQMTPGPIAINAATFVGYRVADFPGAVTATLAVITPATVCLLVVARFFGSLYRWGPCQAALKGLRAVVVALIALAAFSLALTVLESPQELLILGVALGATFLRVHPVLLLLLAGFLGILFFAF